MTLSPKGQGVSFVLLAGLCFSLMALLVKLFASTIGSFQLAWFRAAFGFVTLLVLMPCLSHASIRMGQTSRMLGRACLGVPALLCWMYSYSNLPIDTATAITFTRPLFVLPLALFFLDESTGKGRLSAMLIGFAGVAVALQPTGGQWWPALVGLAGSLVVAMVSVQVKKLAESETVFSITFYNELFCALVFLPLAWITWQPVSPGGWLGLVSIGVLGVLGQMAMTRGLQLCEATTATSLDYFRFVMAAALSMLFLDGDLSPVLLAGVVLIAISGFYIQFERPVSRWLATCKLRRASKPLDTGVISAGAAEQ